MVNPAVSAPAGGGSSGIDGYIRRILDACEAPRRTSAAGELQKAHARALTEKNVWAAGAADGVNGDDEDEMPMPILDDEPEDTATFARPDDSTLYSAAAGVMWKCFPTWDPPTCSTQAEFEALMLQYGFLEAGKETEGEESGRVSAGLPAFAKAEKGGGGGGGSGGATWVDELRTIARGLSTAQGSSLSRLARAFVPLEWNIPVPRYELGERARGEYQNHLRHDVFEVVRLCLAVRHCTREALPERMELTLGLVDSCLSGAEDQARWETAAKNFQLSTRKRFREKAGLGKKPPQTGDPQPQHRKHGMVECAVKWCNNIRKDDCLADRASCKFTHIERYIQMPNIERERRGYSVNTLMSTHALTLWKHYEDAIFALYGIDQLEGTWLVFRAMGWQPETSLYVQAEPQESTLRSVLTAVYFCVRLLHRYPFAVRGRPSVVLNTLRFLHLQIAQHLTNNGVQFMHYLAGPLGPEEGNAATTRERLVRALHPRDSSQIRKMHRAACL